MTAARVCNLFQPEFLSLLQKNGMKKITITLLCLAVVWAAQGQSKTELKKQVADLQAELAELKKPKATPMATLHDRASYGLGVLMGKNILQQGGDSLQLSRVLAGFTDVFAKKELLMPEQECQMLVQDYMQQAMEYKVAKVREEGARFLENNKKAEGVTTTASGLQYKVLARGTGKTPTASQRATVHYTGKLVDGTVFDSSVQRGSPATFGVGDVIKGWTEALQLMREGDKWMLYIPHNLAYGERGAGAQIPPFATLIFEVELLKVE